MPGNDSLLLFAAAGAGAIAACRLVRRIVSSSSPPASTLLLPPGTIACGPLTAVHVKPKAGVDAEPRGPPILLVPGMGHEAWYFRGLQDLLAARGFESYALNLRPYKFFPPSTTVDGGRLQDIKEAMEDLKLRRPVMLGHSQGGLYTQMFADVFDDTMAPEQRLSAVVFYATGALGQFRPFTDLCSQVFRKLSSPSENMYFGLTGKYKTEEQMRRFFLLPETAHTTVVGKKITVADYLKLVNGAAVSALGEGTTTYNQATLLSRWGYVNPRPLTAMPSLVVFPEQDALYRAPHQEWLVDYHQSDLIRVPDQAHCLADDGWEETAGKPLVEWLEKLCF